MKEKSNMRMFIELCVLFSVLNACICNPLADAQQQQPVQQGTGPIPGLNPPVAVAPPSQQQQQQPLAAAVVQQPQQQQQSLTGIPEQQKAPPMAKNAAEASKVIEAIDEDKITAEIEDLQHKLGALQSNIDRVLQEKSILRRRRNAN